MNSDNRQRIKLKITARNITKKQFQKILLVHKTQHFLFSIYSSFFCSLKISYGEIDPEVRTLLPLQGAQVQYLVGELRSPACLMTQPNAAKQNISYDYLTIFWQNSTDLDFKYKLYHSLDKAISHTKNRTYHAKLFNE